MMTFPFVPMAEIRRGGILESLHHGAAVVADADGRVLQAWGDPAFVTFPRSSLKPFQAIPLVETGAADAAGLTEEHLALACASHNAEEFQVALVRGWLERLGLTESALVCGPDLPRAQADQAKVWRGGGDRSRIFHNCSGKHCGFLTLTKHLGASPAYADPAHPAQRMYLEAFYLLLAPGVRAGLIDRMRQVVLRDPVPLLKTIAAPTLLIWGDRDAMVPVANAQDYLQALPRARLVTLPGVGHLPQEEHADAALAALQAFLAE